jgi:molybdopterin-biosynthesis enzyme MoeA-like protein/nicotinamide mononucleotide (NMN) deamidase PncC
VLAPPLYSFQYSTVGVELIHVHHVGDCVEHLSATIKAALARARIVFVVGGLGPTADDVTRDGVADALNETQRVDAKLEDQVREYFSKRKLHMPEQNIRQAHVIDSCTPLRNDRGTAPGWFVEKQVYAQDRLVVVLPGPPGEMRHMYQQEVTPRLQKWTHERFIPQCVVHRTIKIVGLGESTVDEMLKDVMLSVNPVVGIYHGFEGIGVKLSALGESVAACRSLIDNLEHKVCDIIGSHVWGFDDDNLATCVMMMLNAQKKTLAVSECHSGGLFAHSVTNVQGWNNILQSAKVVKHHESYPCVAVEWAIDQAIEIRKRHSTDFGLVISAASEDGTTHVALSYDDQQEPIVHSYMYLHSIESMKHRAVTVALTLLRTVLTDPRFRK